ncbi:MAG: ABC transporter ATP-binding protein [Lachnospiraceae bacterium]|nr:ABC transporter ATP-binding protein [Lachnospiraceae bacterium]
MKLVADKVGYKYYRKNKKVLFELKETVLKPEEGKLTEIVGHSGSGKSTLLNICAGLLTPDTGHLLVGDKDLYSLSDEERSRFRNAHIGIIPQGQSVLKHLTVTENILLPISMYREDTPTNLLNELIENLGLKKLENEKAGGLSGGEMRRVAIARALIGKPEIILADEPTGDLDADNRKLVLTALKNIAGEGKTVLMVTHDREAEEYADKILKMDGGILI